MPHLLAFRLTKTGLSPDTVPCNALRGKLNTWLFLLIWLRFLAKIVSFGLSRLRWRAQSSSRSSLSGRLRSFISSVTHTPSRKYALWSSFGHASLGNSRPAASQRSSKRRSSSCSWTRCVVVGSSISSGVVAAKALVQRFRIRTSV
jgi:hypothetical protein